MLEVLNENGGVNESNSGVIGKALAALGFKMSQGSFVRRRPSWSRASMKDFGETSPVSVTVGGADANADAGKTVSDADDESSSSPDVAEGKAASDDA